MQSIPTLAAASTIAAAAVGLSFASPRTVRHHDDAPRPPPSQSSIMSRLTGSTRPSSSSRHHHHHLSPSNPAVPALPSPPSTQSLRSASHDTASQPSQRQPRLSFNARAKASNAARDSSQSRNKLVKRSGSHGSVPTSSAAAVHTTTTIPIARSQSMHRPATSHQRSSGQSSSRTARPSTSSPATSSPPARSSKLESHHFKPRIALDDLSTRRDSFGGSPFIRRMYPDGTAPTLVRGGTVRPAEMEVDAGLAGLSSAATPWHSRPSTSAGKQTQSSPIPPPPELPESADGRGRRSFSINHLLSSKNDNGRPNRLLRRKSPRYFSAPAADTIFDHDLSPLGPNSPVDRADGAALSPIPSIPPMPSPPTRSHTSMSRPSRPSTTPSELNSSHVGSDVGTRVFSSSDEEDLDLRSDTNYDSVRTAYTKSAPQSAPLHSLFDKPPDLPEVPELSDVGSTPALVDSPATVITRGRNPNMEEESNASTPVRTVMGRSRESSHKHSSPQLRPTDAARSSRLQQALSLGTLSWNAAGDESEPDWDGDDTTEDDWNTPFETPTPLETSKKLMWAEDATNSRQGAQSPSKLGRSPSTYEPKSSLFDWAEQSTSANNGSTTPPRPKTVHGKKDPDLRGPRSTGRRAPSSLHTRSHSVPVLADADNQRSNMTTKFGTWGIGSKGPAEDWNDDFLFDEPDDGEETVEAQLSALRIEVRPPTSGGMHVPSGILIAQTNVLANIGLLREWGLLIEELKELRARAITLGVSHDRYEGTFDEVDAMIDLADQEAEDEGVAGVKARNSANAAFDDDFDDFDEAEAAPSPRMAPADEDDVFTAGPSGPPGPGHSVARKSLSPAPRTRPRKDSAAIARSVIEELHRRRAEADSSLTRGPKMEFDTATLKHIVPYVSGLMRKVKIILRDAEGLNTSPRRDHVDPPISQVFAVPTPGSPSAGRSKKSQSRSNDQLLVGDVTRDMHRLNMAHDN